MPEGVIEHEWIPEDDNDIDNEARTADEGAFFWITQQGEQVDIGGDEEYCGRDNDQARGRWKR